MSNPLAAAMWWSAFMIVIYIMIAMWLCGCADTRPTLSSIKATVDERIRYKHYNASDYRYVAPGETDEGNCAVFAETYCVDARKAGYSAERKVVYTGWGEAHAICVADGWTMDNMKKRVY